MNNIQRKVTQGVVRSAAITVMLLVFLDWLVISLLHFTP